MALCLLRQSLWGSTESCTGAQPGEKSIPGQCIALVSLGEHHQLDFLQITSKMCPESVRSDKKREEEEICVNSTDDDPVSQDSCVNAIPGIVGTRSGRKAEQAMCDHSVESQGAKSGDPGAELQGLWQKPSTRAQD